MYQQTVDGTPLINPVFYLYPEDEDTFGLDLQYFYGDALLVAPVTEEGATSVELYLPQDTFYDWYTLEQIQGTGEFITVTEQTLTDIPLYIRGGAIIPLRTESAMTTKELRDKDFNLLIALDSNGQGRGQLYLDDGVSLQQNATTLVQFSYADGKLVAEGTFGYGTGVVISNITLLGLNSTGTQTNLTATDDTSNLDNSGMKTFNLSQPLTARFEIDLESLE